MSTTVRTGLLAFSAVLVIVAVAIGTVVISVKKPSVTPLADTGALASRDPAPVPKVPTPPQSDPKPNTRVEIEAAVALPREVTEPPPPLPPAAPEPDIIIQPKSAPPQVRPKAKSPTPVPAPVVSPDPEKPKYPALEPGKVTYRDYRLNTIQGFSTYISHQVFEENDRAGGWPLDCLQQELDDICKVVPSHLLKPLRTVKVFVEWDHAEPKYPAAVAVFYGGVGEGLLTKGVLPKKAGHVTILSLKRINEFKRRDTSEKKEIVILHELAHAVHYYSLGNENPFIKNAYEQAMARHLYDNAHHISGGLRKAYAATNEHEYFAELTCAFIDRCDYFPHTRDELRDHDSVGYELMKKVWGQPAPMKKSRPIMRLK